MARLLTDHDPYHVHAILGLLSVLHFAWRWGLVLATGSCYPPWEPRAYQVAGTSLHILLTLASLHLPLPVKRMLKKPMIWPEYRMHAAIFSSRHALAAILGLVALRVPALLAPVPLAFAALNHAALFASSVATWSLGDKDATSVRTTNATPYPAHVPMAEVERTRRSYGSAQFLAASMLLTGEPSLCFMPVLPIQIAAFLMTLVRKNIATATHVHVCYAWALMANNFGMLSYLYFQPAGNGGWRHVLVMVIAWRVSINLRCKANWDKHVCWLLAAVCAWGARHLAETHTAPIDQSVGGLADWRDKAAFGLLVFANLNFMRGSPNVCFGPIAGGKGEGRDRDEQRIVELRNGPTAAG